MFDKNAIDNEFKKLEWFIKKDEEAGFIEKIMKIDDLAKTGDSPLARAVRDWMAFFQSPERAYKTAIDEYANSITEKYQRKFKRDDKRYLFIYVNMEKQEEPILSSPTALQAERDRVKKLNEALVEKSYSWQQMVAGCVKSYCNYCLGRPEVKDNKNFTIKFIHSKITEYLNRLSPEQKNDFSPFIKGVMTGYLTICILGEGISFNTINNKKLINEDLYDAVKYQIKKGPQTSSQRFTFTYPWSLETREWISGLRTPKK